MEWFVKAFLKASLAWLGLGVSLGLAMAVHPAWTVYRAVHLHMNLLGFVAMMIFGVAYHVIPRFTGHALYSRRLAAVQWWSANVGLAVFAIGLAAQTRNARGAGALLAVGGTLSAVGAFVFIFNIWRTIDGPRPAPLPSPRRAERPLGRSLQLHETTSGISSETR
ncbi:MAG TPA: cbb3-type cytochrome c oxidase subunit I [Gemmatimonadaceae bacterium]|nr:cbb3-type cytochrome c oxidase subunit I [Gemmatimonadaceae bacterium]